ncbi:MAG: MBG domain-containing protein, partial [Sandarakinorhabdus sp.]
GTSPFLSYEVVSGVPGNPQNGLVNGDRMVGALSTDKNRPISQTDVGTHRITLGTLSAGSNYTIQAFNSANLVITRRPLTITAQAVTQVYGDATPALTYTLGFGDSLVNGNTLSGALSTQASPTRGVGIYPITSTLTAGNNYQITYVGANATITKRPLTITALNADRYYGDGNPAFAYLVGGRGLVNGDGLTGSLTSSATVRSNVGRYAITQGSLVASSNYQVSYNGAFLDVVRRPIVITPTTVERTYGDTVPDYIFTRGVKSRSLPFTVSGITQGFTTLTGLVNGDALVGELGTNATSTSEVGQYSITLGTMADSNPNYRLLIDNAFVLVRPQ